MSAKYCFQCRQSGQRTYHTFSDTDTMTIEEQVKLHIRYYNCEVTDYKYQ